MELIPFALRAERADLATLAGRTEERDLMAATAHATNDELKVSGYSYNYDEFAALDPAEVSRPIIIALVIATLVTLFILLVKKLPICHITAIFIATFLIMLLVFGTHYLKNLSFFIIIAIVIIMVITIFAFATYKVLGCHD